MQFSWGKARHILDTYVVVQSYECGEPAQKGECIERPDCQMRAQFFVWFVPRGDKKSADSVTTLGCKCIYPPSVKVECNHKFRWWTNKCCELHAWCIEIMVCPWWNGPGSPAQYVRRSMSQAMIRMRKSNVPGRAINVADSVQSKIGPASKATRPGLILC